MSRNRNVRVAVKPHVSGAARAAAILMNRDYPSLPPEDALPEMICDKTEPDLSEGRRRDDTWLLREEVGELRPRPDASEAKAHPAKKPTQTRKR